MIRYHLSLVIIILTNFVSAQINPQNITIARDDWGVPHIFGQTDQEVAYGLAWATAEDDFKTMQEQMLAVRGKLGLVNGKSGAALDVAMHIIEADRVVAERYVQDLSPKFRAVLDAYAAGANAYASHHPKELLRKDIFPINGKDIIKGYLLGVTFITKAEEDLGRILNGKIKNWEEAPKPEGSNAFAINSSKTRDGKTYLAINSHQPLEGLYSWYEIHLHSEEGLNFLGATFPGGVTPFLGTNENLGWAQTLNYPDLSDVYKLHMHPEKALTYRFDGKWETLKPYPAKARIKMMGIRVGQKQKFYKSKYGITFQNDHGFYALRFPANRYLKAAEQYYRMSKARSFEEFKEVLSIQGLISTNIVYADREDNIYYLSNGRFPKRDPAYNWQLVLPGDTSATLWSDDYYPVDSLPQVENPSSGFVYNCNNSPFLSSGPDDNPDPHQTPLTMGFQQADIHTNRSFRLYEQLKEINTIDYEEFKQIKFDKAYGKPMVVFAGHSLEHLFEMKAADHPAFSDILIGLQDWDRISTLDSKEAGFFAIFLYYLVRVVRSQDRFLPGQSIEEVQILAALERAKDHMVKHFGSTMVPLQRIQRHIRGEVDLAVAGGADALAAIYGSMLPDGRLKARAGESYIELVKYSAEGVEIESINAYGASAKPASPHYTDQMEMYTRQKLKPMTLDKESILSTAKRIYHPK